MEKTDQEEGQYRGEFPENEQEDQVFGEHQSEHGPAEEEQEYGKSSPSLVAFHVWKGKQKDQCPDSSD